MRMMKKASMKMVKKKIRGTAGTFKEVNPSKH